MAEMIKNMTNDMLELDPHELLEITGGNAASEDNDAAYAAAVEFAKYMDQLLEKYNYPTPSALKKCLTPEEKTKVREMRRAVFAAM